MIPARIKSYIVHYAYGLFAAGWKGAWNALGGIMGIDSLAMTGAIQSARLLNWHEMLGAWAGGFVIHGIIWIIAHPIPAELPENSTP